MQTTVYQYLHTMFWFCSFHSALIPGGLSSSHRIPPVHYSFGHNSIPSPIYHNSFSHFLIEGHSFIFQFFATTKSDAINIFVQITLSMTSSSHVFKQLFFFCVSTPVVLPLHVDSVLSHRSLIVVLDQCIAASRGIHYI